MKLNQAFNAGFGLLAMLALMAQLRAQSCTDLEDEESLRTLHAAAIKRAILFKLQLQREPKNPVGPIVVPQDVLDEYQAVSAAEQLVSQQQVGCAEQPVHPPQFTVLQPLEVLRRSGYHGVRGDFPLNSTHALQSPAHLLSFNLDLTDKEIISSTELRLWYRILSNESLSHSDKQRISIFHVFKQNSDNYYGEDPTHYCTRELVSLERDGYVNFNITSALKQWLDWTDEDRGMFYLEVNIEDLQTVNDDGEVVFQSPAIEIVYTDIEGRYSKTTQLVLRTYSNNDLRRKRQQQEMHNSCSSEASKSCCKRTLVLDIRRDLGWTWILRPRKLTANFCSGFCSIDGPTATYHTLLNLIYHSVQSNPTGSPAPCCVPDKFAPVPLLIFNRTNIELVTVDDISIQSCICR